MLQHCCTELLDCSLEPRTSTLVKINSLVIVTESLCFSAIGFSMMKTSRVLGSELFSRGIMFGRCFCWFGKSTGWFWGCFSSETFFYGEGSSERPLTSLFFFFLEHFVEYFFIFNNFVTDNSHDMMSSNPHLCKILIQIVLTQWFVYTYDKLASCNRAFLNFLSGSSPAVTLSYHSSSLKFLSNLWKILV